MYLRPSFFQHHFLENNITSPPQTSIFVSKGKTTILPQQLSPLRSALQQAATHLSQALLSGGYRDFAMNFCRQQRLPPALCESIAERLESLTRRLPVKGTGVEAAKVAKAKAKVGWVGLGGMWWLGKLLKLRGVLQFWMALKHTYWPHQYVEWVLVGILWRLFLIFWDISSLVPFRRKTFFLKDLQILPTCPPSLGQSLWLWGVLWATARLVPCGAGHLWIQVMRRPCVAGWGPCRRNCGKLRSSRCLGPVGRARLFYICGIRWWFWFMKILFGYCNSLKMFPNFNWVVGISQAPFLLFGV